MQKQKNCFFLEKNTNYILYSKKFQIPQRKKRLMQTCIEAFIF